MPAFATPFGLIPGDRFVDRLGVCDRPHVTQPIELDDLDTRQYAPEPLRHHPRGERRARRELAAC